eukprot:comp100454_c0_seq1/m.48729 comp100454_c0_seq1/g.48729  ORF comp100454_c0_seq1/g.48729 comp100454_c0_seq1/m.48729 type:complete len:163 (-) comp100454_c0_seq1:43-531(-)
MIERECTAGLAEALYSERAQTLVKNIKGLRCRALQRGVTCRPCSRSPQRKDTKGYYDADNRRAVLCCENIVSQKDLEDTLVHELVHAYDNCRKYQFGRVPSLRACSEIRAAHLGQCYDSNGFFRRYCVKKEAMKSLGGHEEAKRIVELVFEHCYRDRAPFVQ